LRVFPATRYPAGMSAVSARRSRAPTNPVRAFSLLLAALASAVLLVMLLYGLSGRAIEAMRQMPLLVQLLPEPQPTPAVPPPPPPPSRAMEKVRPERAAAVAAPAPVAAPPPASVVDRTPVAEAIPAPASAPVASTGSSVGSGSASGSGGSGTGGNGAGGFGTGGGLLPPSWVVVPGYRELAPHNPGIARNEKINGTVLLACHGTARKRLTGCRVVYESPKGYGFGEAGLASARSFRINPPMRDGRIDEAAWIGIPVSFNNKR
jgi:TonB family protein